MFAFRRADTPGQSPEASQRAGVAVRTNQRDAGQRDALLRGDHVDDALPVVAQVEEGDSRSSGRGPRAGDEVPAAGHPGIVGATGCRIHDVIHGAEHLLRVSDPPPGRFQALQGNAAGAFVEEDAVDVQQTGGVPQFGNGVLCPELVKNRAAHGAVWRHSGKRLASGAQ